MKKKKKFSNAKDWWESLSYSDKNIVIATGIMKGIIDKKRAFAKLTDTEIEALWVLVG